MRIVFLDFDGVLVNEFSFRTMRDQREAADPACVAALNAITDATGAAIVVSSTWRRGTSVITLRELLRKWGVTAKVIGKTPSLYEGSFSLPRGDEIAHWLKGYARDVEGFVILDDDVDMGDLTPHLVKTKFNDGLTAEHVPQAIEILKGQANGNDKG
jgi:hypothetical protein